jgi:serine phosphatase RsbU (regulator of sigma subunit)
MSAAQSEGILRSLAKESNDLQHIVEALNVEMVKNLSEIYYFSTMVLCQLNVRTGIMHIVSAGHPPCFYYDAMKDEFTRVMNTGPLVGLIPGARFDQETIELKMGDCFFMYTDGIVEAPSEMGGEMYGEDRLFSFFQSNITRPSMDIVHTLLGTVYEYTGYQSMQDDVTVICIKRIG